MGDKTFKVSHVVKTIRGDKDDDLKELKELRQNTFG